MNAAERNDGAHAGDARPPRLVAFYLPQFHPTPENDLWWGKGFTEWTNVAKASPLFDGHYQPHLPADFGFYDLRVRETRRDQIEVAKRFGIDAFCYHYYWFSGRRLLNLPLDDMLSDPGSDMPFCLCWANENWTRRWDAADHEILIEQKYLPEDDERFADSVIPFFRDPRYLRVDGRPLLIVYTPQRLPDPLRTLRVWRERCREAGVGEIHVCAALTHHNERFAELGFDSGVEFPPHNLRAPNVNRAIAFRDAFVGNVVQFATLARSYLERRYPAGRVFRTVFPSWDNTARTGRRALVVLNGTPANYEHWLASAIDLAASEGDRDPVVFVNAWNEWAEGCHLEPDRRYGQGFLQATRDAKSGARRYASFPDQGLPVAPDQPARTLAGDVAAAFSYHASRRLGEAKMAVNRRPWLRRLLIPVARALRPRRRAD
jgi:lipopolysaccharide biosynthesis protein